MCSGNAKGANCSAHVSLMITAVGEGRSQNQNSSLTLSLSFLFLDCSKTYAELAAVLHEAGMNLIYKQKQANSNIYQSASNVYSIFNYGKDYPKRIP